MIKITKKQPYPNKGLRHQNQHNNQSQANKSIIILTIIFSLPTLNHQ